MSETVLVVLCWLVGWSLGLALGWLLAELGIAVYLWWEAR